MREYETTFIVQPEISDEGCQDLFARIDGILEREGATKLLHEDQGKRKLAYEIRKFQKGRYITTHFLDEGKAVAPLERTLRLEESVLRFLTVQVTDRVEDVEARKQAAAEEERIRAERARERAAREAEEEKARQEAARLAGEHYAEQDLQAGRLEDDAEDDADEDAGEEVDEDAGEEVDEAEEEDEDEEIPELEDSDDSELENGGER